MTGKRTRTRRSSDEGRARAAEAAPPRIYSATLGCRLNAYETDAIVEELASLCGAVRAPSPEEADVVLLNSCAVTAKAQARSRKTLRSLARRTRGMAVATGCVAEVYPEDLAEEGVLVVPNAGKAELAGRIVEMLGITAAEPGGEGRVDSIFPRIAPLGAARTRTFLKVQDGCDNRCSYCIVPHARGGSRSQPREEVLRQAKDLREAGYREIVLTGVDIAAYGRDLYGSHGYGLPDLVRGLLRLGGFRVRISSMEPVGLTADMLARMALPGVCRHFHLPLQSGSDRILSAMRRGYGRAREEELLDRIRGLFPGAAVGADIIVGFPGETDDDFAQTLDLIAKHDLSYLHVFPFSPRPGTPAADMDGMLSPHTVADRARALRELGAEARRRFRLSRLGEDALCLVEGRSLDGATAAMTDNYVPVLLDGDAEEGDMVPVTLTPYNIAWGRR